MAWNPAQQFQISQRIPTRMVPSGTITLAAGDSQLFPGSNARQDRVQFVIHNLDGSQILKLRSANHLIGATIFASTGETFETSADIEVYNPGTNSVDFEVMEFYPDTGNVHAVPAIQGGLAPDTTPGVPASLGGGTPAGGGLVTSGNGGRSGGGRTPNIP